MKKLFNFLILSLTTFILSTISVEVLAAATDKETLISEAQSAYNEYKPLSKDYYHTHSSESAKNFFIWKFTFMNKLKFLKANEPFTNYLTFFSHFLKLMYNTALPDAKYIDSLTSIDWPTQELKAGVLTITFISGYTFFDYRVII